MTESKTPPTFSGATGDLLLKVLGPVFEEFGKNLQERVSAKRRKKTEQIVQNATAKLGNKLETPGAVPLRVVKEVINKGSYHDNPVAIEYYGGVLASSRTEDGQDDGGAVIAKSIERLSTSEIRMHYLIYATIHQLFKDSGKSLLEGDCDSMSIYIGIPEYRVAMGFNAHDIESQRKQKNILSASLYGLYRADLIEKFKAGGQEMLLDTNKPAPCPGIIITPSFHGAEVFLYAFGMGDVFVEDFLKTEIQYDIEGILKGFPNAQIVKK